jgi:hypothetical protein
MVLIAGAPYRSKSQSKSSSGSRLPLSLQGRVLDLEPTVRFPPHARWFGRQLIMLEGTEEIVAQALSDPVSAFERTVVDRLGLGFGV